MTGGKITTEKLSSLKGQGRGRRRSSNTSQSNLFNLDMNPNPPAPHAPYGGDLGLKDLIGNVKVLRSSQTSVQMPSRGHFRLERTRRGPEGLASPQGTKDSDGPLTPIAKLLKKVRSLKDSTQNRANIRYSKFCTWLLSTCHLRMK